MNETELAALDLVWGCAEIARVIRKTPKATYHLLSGRLPARKEPPHPAALLRAGDAGGHRPTATMRLPQTNA
jgi:hypothetical protein